uniref:Putative conserved plasma membrane protein n=1 Tax=Ixodes ricinus TaxID=34613 RepID=A0A6B0V4N6_IXORI
MFIAVFQFKSASAQPMYKTPENQCLECHVQVCSLHWSHRCLDVTVRNVTQHKEMGLCEPAFTRLANIKGCLHGSKQCSSCMLHENGLVSGFGWLFHIARDARSSLMFARVVVLCQALRTSKQHTVTYNCLSSVRDASSKKKFTFVLFYMLHPIHVICINMASIIHITQFFIRDKHFGLSFHSHFVCPETSFPTYFCPKHSLCIQHSRDLRATPPSQARSQDFVLGGARP